jgi:hypothetical protein
MSVGIRGQGVSPFWDSEGKLTVKAIWHEERTFRAFCGGETDKGQKCMMMLSFKGKKETTCPRCGTVNDLS